MVAQHFEKVAKMKVLGWKVLGYPPGSTNSSLAGKSQHFDGIYQETNGDFPWRFVSLPEGNLSSVQFALGWWFDIGGLYILPKYMGDYFISQYKDHYKPISIINGMSCHGFVAVAPLDSESIFFPRKSSRHF